MTIDRDDYADVDTDNVAEMADFCRELANATSTTVARIICEELDRAGVEVPYLGNGVFAIRTAARIADLIAEQVS